MYKNKLQYTIRERAIEQRLKDRNRRETVLYRSLQEVLAK